MSSKYEIMPSVAGSGSALFRNVASVLERVEYRLCRDDFEFEEIAKLRYRSYLEYGVASQNDAEMLVDDLDFSPNSYVFGVHLDGELVSTLRIHYVSKEYPDSLSLQTFPEVVNARLDGGEAFVDPTKFAIDPKVAGAVRALPFLTIRLASMACEYFPVTGVLTLVAGHHGGFYEKIFKASTLAEPRACDGVLVQAKLMLCSKYEFRDHVLTNFPFLFPREGEPERLFKRQRKMEMMD